MHVLYLTPEVNPWCGTGGLAEVAGAFPAALQRADASLRVAVFAPLYAVVRRAVAARGQRLVDAGVEVRIPFLGDRVARFCSVEGHDPRVFFVDCPELFDRPGIYGDGWGYSDNAQRFALLSAAAVAAAPALMGGVPDVVHANDWQTAAALVYARRQWAETYGHARTVFTIHNLAYQGDFPRDMVDELGFDWADFAPDAFEFHDRLNLLKAGVAFAQTVTTVSPTYAREICTPEGGFGLDGFLRFHSSRIHGVLNGIDERSWDPAIDPAICANFSVDAVGPRARCRRALCDELGLQASADDLVVGIVSRLVEQKGLDLLAQVVPALVEEGVRFVLVGDGDPSLQTWWSDLASAHPGRVAVRFVYEPALARRVFAGSDATAVPSRWEPGGLAQLFAMRYGALPIVAPVGGLLDTVVDADAPEGTGFVLPEVSSEAIRDGIARAAKYFREDRGGWTQLQRRAMERDSSWTRAARAWVDLYRA